MVGFLTKESPIYKPFTIWALFIVLGQMQNPLGCQRQIKWPFIIKLGSRWSYPLRAPQLTPVQQTFGGVFGSVSRDAIGCHAETNMAELKPTPKNDEDWQQRIRQLTTWETRVWGIVTTKRERQWQILTPFNRTRGSRLEMTDLLPKEYQSKEWQPDMSSSAVVPRYGSTGQSQSIDPHSDKSYVSIYRSAEFRREVQQKEREAARAKRDRQQAARGAVKSAPRTVITVDTSKARSNIDVVRLCIRELRWREVHVHWILLPFSAIASFRFIDLLFTNYRFFFLSMNHL